MPPEIPKPKKYTDEVSTIKPHSHKNWPGSHEKAAEGGKKSE